MNENDIKRMIEDWFFNCQSEDEINELTSTILDAMELARDCRLFDFKRNE